MNNAQLELSLIKPSTRRGPQRSRSPRMQRATWWFSQMRQIVDNAMTWEDTHPPRPEQIYLPGTHRQVQLSSR